MEATLSSFILGIVASGPVFFQLFLIDAVDV